MKKVRSQFRLGDELLDRLKTEQDQLVQTYIVDAIVGIGYGMAPTIEKLTQMYGDLSDFRVARSIRPVTNLAAMPAIPKTPDNQCPIGANQRLNHIAPSGATL